MVIETRDVTTHAHVGCGICGQHTWLQVDAKFFFHDNGARTYEFTATDQVAMWYNTHRAPRVIEFSRV